MNIIQQIPVIKSSSNLKLIWDIYHSIIILIFVFLIPIRLAFSIDASSIITSELTICMVLSLLFDSLVSMNTGYYS